MLSAHSASRAAFFAALFASSAPLVSAFSPIFGVPRQCGSLKITWTSSPISEADVSSVAMTDIPVSLVPLDNDPSRFAPEVYTIAVPFHPDHSGGEYEIDMLPFPAGTQFFASAHVPGVGGFVKRVVSTVLTVEESVDSSCLPRTHMNAQAHAQSQGRARSKGFGKRQVNVIGATQVDANAVPSGDATSSSASASASGGPVNVIGVNVIPADQAAAGGATDTASASITGSTGVTGVSTTETATGTTLTVGASATGTSSGAVPAISVIGVNEIPAAGAASGTESSSAAATTSSGFVSVPINAAQSTGAAAPSSTGAVPVVQVIGVSFIDADGADVQPDGSNLAASGTTVESGAATTYTAYTEAAPTEAAPTETANPEAATENPYENPYEAPYVEAPYVGGEDNGMEGEEDLPVEEGCDDSQQAEENNHESNQNNSSPYNSNSGDYSQYQNHGSSESNQYSGSHGNGRHGGSRHGSYNRQHESYGQNSY